MVMVPMAVMMDGTMRGTMMDLSRLRKRWPTNPTYIASLYQDL